MDAARHCRIGRVRMKAGGADVRIIGPVINHEARDMVRNLAGWIESGEVVGVGIVAVGRNGNVTTGFNGPTCFHSLNSGAALLAGRLSIAVDS